MVMDYILALASVAVSIHSKAKAKDYYVSTQPKNKKVNNSLGMLKYH